MDPEEIARREQERAEKKKRKQERKLLKSQGKLLPGESFHTPGGSESDSGVSQFTDSEQQTSNHNGTIHLDRAAAGHQTDSGCDQTRHNFSQLQNHPNQRTPGEAEQVSPESAHGCGPGPGGPRSSALHKRNPFSVESLLSDATPRRKTQLDFSPARTLVGKGHFLLYPITHQPLGFLVPQTALKASPCPDGGISRLGRRCESAEGSPAPSDLCKLLNPDHTDDGGAALRRHREHLSNRPDAGDAEDCGDRGHGAQSQAQDQDQEQAQTQAQAQAQARVRLSSASAAHDENASRVCAEAATNGCRAEPASPERLETDCPEGPATDGEDVDMD